MRRFLKRFRRERVEFWATRSKVTGLFWFRKGSPDGQLMGDPDPEIATMLPTLRDLKPGDPPVKVRLEVLS